MKSEIKKKKPITKRTFLIVYWTNRNQNYLPFEIESIGIQPPVESGMENGTLATVDSGTNTLDPQVSSSGMLCIHRIRRESCKQCNRSRFW